MVHVRNQSQFIMDMVYLFIFNYFAFLEFFYRHDLVCGFITCKFHRSEGSLTDRTRHHVIVYVDFLGLLELHTTVINCKIFIFYFKYVL
jgi:hypothetical protein